jgi:putative ABC transport system permease protein
MVRAAFRNLRRAPAFAAISILTLGLGIGANTAIFSVLNAVILRPLAYPLPEQLMFLTASWPGLKSTERVSPPEYFEFTELNRSFAAVGAYQMIEMNLAALDRPRRVSTAAVTGEVFEALGVRPLQGRWFTRDETRIPPVPIVVLSHALWQSAFAGRPDLVGETIEVNGAKRQVVGIMPPGFDVMDNRAEIFIPAALNRANRQNRGNHVLSLVGRLKPGVTQGQANAELRTLLANWGERTGAKAHVFNPTEHFLQMTPMQGEIVGAAGRAIGVLQAAVAVVLLIACANFASLLLARSEARRREFAVRTALGAGRFRLLLQFATEGTMLSLIGGALGMALAWAGVRSLVRTFAGVLPRASEIAIDASTLVFALALAVVTGVVFGLAPLLHVSRLDLDASLKEGGTRGATPGRHRLRRGLVAAEVALAVMLVAGAGLMLRTVVNLTSVDAGFDRSRLVTFTTAFPGLAYPTYARRAQVYERIVSALGAVPGVQSVSGMSGLPPLRELDVNDTTFSNFTWAPGKPPAQVDFYQRVEPDYFETMGIPIVHGRAFQRSDLYGPLLAVVNERLARTYWPGLDPIGQTLTPCCGTQAFTVVGVSRGVKQGGVDQETGTEAYFFDAQRIQFPDVNGGGVLHVVIRTDLAVSVLRPVIERAMREADPALPIAKLREMDDVFSETLGRPRMVADLLGGLAGLALLLTAIGTYGVLSYTVAERRREIGIRMALGAGRTSVLGSVMSQGLAVTAVGMAFGLAGAFAVTRLMGSMLFGVKPTDLATLASVAATILLVAAAACYLPAYRATRIDPLTVLRDE